MKVLQDKSVAQERVIDFDWRAGAIQGDPSYSQYGGEGAKWETGERGSSEEEEGAGRYSDDRERVDDPSKVGENGKG